MYTHMYMHVHTCMHIYFSDIFQRYLERVCIWHCFGVTFRGHSAKVKPGDSPLAPVHPHSEHTACPAPTRVHPEGQAHPVDCDKVIGGTCRVSALAAGHMIVLCSPTDLPVGWVPAALNYLHLRCLWHACKTMHVTCTPCVSQ